MSPNSIRLFRLSLAGKSSTTTSGSSPFTLNEVLSLSGEEYQANSWLMKLAVSGSMVMAPTVTGDLLVLDLNAASGSCSIGSAMTARFRHHDSLEVRQATVHPFDPICFTCADDGTVRIYIQ